MTIRVVFSRFAWRRYGGQIVIGPAITVMSLLLLIALLTAEAQQVGRVWRIAFIVGSYAKAQDAFTETLRELGYVEGQNILIERRFSGGRTERFQEFAAEMVRLKVDAIVVNTTPAAFAAKNATKTIPIVIPTSIDPVGAGLVASLTRPGGNVTGVAALWAELIGKRLELLKEIAPQLSRVAVLWNPANPANTSAWKEADAAARTLGVTLQSQEVRDVKDFENVFILMAKSRPDALLLLEDNLTAQFRQQIADFAIQKHLPGAFAVKESVTAGGLMSYGPSLTDLWRRAAVYVDKILKGARPSDLPMEQPTRFELTINLKTAKALGLTIPPSMLLRADQVIE
jgi:putative ABC transport system substrate-binding protein